MMKYQLYSREPLFGQGLDHRGGACMWIDHRGGACMWTTMPIKTAHSYLGLLTTVSLWRYMYMYMYMHGPQCPLRYPIAARYCPGEVHVHVGVLCCFALFVCLTLLASFFLPSHLSLKHVYTCTYIHAWATMWLEISVYVITMYVYT